MIAGKDEATGIWTIEGLEPWQVTYNKMLEKLKGNKAFKFARYGDGEIYCMKGKNGQNCDNHKYFTDMGAALRNSIQSEPPYMVGIQPLSVSHLTGDVLEYFGHIKNLYNADVLHNASIDGQLQRFINAITGRYVILVGPSHLACMVQECVHIVIPDLDCWTEYQNISQQIHFHVDGINNAVVLLCASMMSEVIIADFSDYPHTFIDCGSVLDPYAGVKSRRYHYKLKV